MAFLFSILLPSYFQIISTLFPSSALFPHNFHTISNFHSISIVLPFYFHGASVFLYLIYAPKVWMDDVAFLFTCVAEGKLSAEQAKSLLEKGKELGVINKLGNESSAVQKAKTFSSGVGTSKAKAGSQELSRSMAFIIT